MSYELILNDDGNVIIGEAASQTIGVRGHNKEGDKPEAGDGIALFFHVQLAFVSKMLSMTHEKSQPTHPPCNQKLK